MLVARSKLLFLASMSMTSATHALEGQPKDIPWSVEMDVTYSNMSPIVHAILGIPSTFAIGRYLEDMESVDLAKPNSPVGPCTSAPALSF